MASIGNYALKQPSTVYGSSNINIKAACTTWKSCSFTPMLHHATPLHASISGFLSIGSIILAAVACPEPNALNHRDAYPKHAYMNFIYCHHPFEPPVSEWTGWRDLVREMGQRFEYR